MSNVQETNPSNFMWVEKYRPKTIDQCVLPDRIKTLAKDLVAKGEIPHMMLHGGPGMGKTTLAYAIANEIGSDVMYINASLENGIDTLRVKIQGFASTVSLSDSGPKIIILDEADGLTPVMQGALKGFLEAFSNNCRFVFTANIKNKLIEPLHSRCTVIDFKVESAEKVQMAKAMLARIKDILDRENITYDVKALAELITRNFPDFRKTINEVQRYSAAGSIDSGILVNTSKEAFKELLALMKDKNFNEVRKWITKNGDYDATTVFRHLFDNGEAVMKDTKSVANLVLIIADYQHRAAFVADPEINLMACLTEVMGNCAFK